MAILLIILLIAIIVTGNSGIRDVEIIVPLKNKKKHLKCLWLIAKLLFNWHVLKKSILVAGTAAIQVPKFLITNTTLYVPAIIWSTQENIKLLKQLESGFKRIINQNKYYSEKTNQTQKK